LAFFIGAGLAVIATILIASVRLPRTDRTLPRMVSVRSILAIFVRRDVFMLAASFDVVTRICP
jgi:hypothetical protein